MKKPFTLLETCISYYSFNTDVIYDSNVVNKMSMIAYFKPAHDDIEKLIKKHVDKCRKNIPWDGEHKQVRYSKDI